MNRSKRNIPKSLKVVSIVTIVLGIIRLVAGIIILTTDLSEGWETQIILENLVAGILILISGGLLYKGNGFGRVLLIAAALLAFAVSFFMKGNASLGTLIIFGSLIGLLFFERSIKEYFQQ